MGQSPAQETRRGPIAGTMVAKNMAVEFGVSGVSVGVATMLTNPFGTFGRLKEVSQHACVAPCVHVATDPPALGGPKCIPKCTPRYTNARPTQYINSGLQQLCTYA